MNYSGEMVHFCYKDFIILIKSTLNNILKIIFQKIKTKNTFLFERRMVDHYFLHCANAFIGINASGKTSVLKVVNLAMNIINNEPINHIEAKEILGKTNEAEYFIQSERLWEKSISSVKSKKYLTDFTSIEPIAVRSNNEMYLSDDVSFIIAHNKKYNASNDIKKSDANQSGMLEGTTPVYDAYVRLKKNLETSVDR